MNDSGTVFGSLSGNEQKRAARARRERRRSLQIECLEIRELPSGGLTPTTLQFTVPPDVVYGEGFELQAFVGVPPGAAPPTGEVTYAINGVPQSAIPVSNLGTSVGIAVLSLKPPSAPGTYSYTATYSGDRDYAPSSASAQNTVERLSTAVRLTSTSSTTFSGQSLTFSANVTVLIPEPQGLTIPVPPFTGSVSFMDGNTVVASIPVEASGLATFTTSAFTVGSHQITAVYSGNADLGASTSNTVTETVNPRDLGPVITSVQRFGYHAQPTRLVLTFNKALASSSATDVANYSIVRLNHRDMPVGRPITVASANYDAATQTVTLAPSHRLNVHSRYRLTVSGSAPNGVVDEAGVFLAGSGEGDPGTDYTTVISRASLAGPSVEKPIVFRRAAVPRHFRANGRS